MKDYKVIGQAIAETWAKVDDKLIITELINNLSERLKANNLRFNKDKFKHYIADLIQKDKKCYSEDCGLSIPHYH